jgi:hypothetical protein
VTALAPLPKIQAAPYVSEKYLPYRVLWVKVIIRAAFDYTLWKDSKDFKLRRHALDAERWFFSESSLVNSFTKICEVLKIDPEHIRECVRRLTRDQVKKMEFKEREGKDLMSAIVFGHLESGDDGDTR